MRSRGRRICVEEMLNYNFPSASGVSECKSFSTGQRIDLGPSHLLPDRGKLDVFL